MISTGTLNPTPEFAAADRTLRHGRPGWAIRACLCPVEVLNVTNFAQRRRLHVFPESPMYGANSSSTYCTHRCYKNTPDPDTPRRRSGVGPFVSGSQDACRRRSTPAWFVIRILGQPGSDHNFADHHWRRCLSDPRVRRPQVIPHQGNSNSECHPTSARAILMGDHPSLAGGNGSIHCRRDRSS